MERKVWIAWLVTMGAVVLDGLTVGWGGYFNLALLVILPAMLPVALRWAERVDRQSNA